MYMNVLNSFTPYFQYPNNSAIDDLLMNYLDKNLIQNTSSNPTGVWYGAKHKPANNYNDMQYGTIDGFNYDYYTFNNTSTPTRLIGNSFNAFGVRLAEGVTPSSSSLELCTTTDQLANNNSSPNFVTGFPAVNNHTVQAFHMYPGACYPFYDRTAAIYLTAVNPSRLSVLSRNDNVYRGSILNPGVTGLETFVVSLINHNTTHMSMGFKKMSSITMYNFNNTIKPPTNCSDAGKSNFNMYFKDLPYNFIFCSLLKTMSGPNGTYNLIQATGKHYSKNHAINAVYTIQNGESDESGQSVMIDLNMFAVYTIEGQLPTKDEHGALTI